MSRYTSSTLQPLESRLAEGRPVMTREQLVAIGKRILQMSSVDIVNVTVTHIARFVTRLANGRVLLGDDGEFVQIYIETMVGGPPAFYVYTNQLDDSVLLAGLQQCEALLRAGVTYQPDSGMKRQPRMQDAAVPVHHWHQSTVRAMATVRNNVVPEILGAVGREQLQAAGFVGLMARAEAVVRKEGDIIFFHEETDCEVTVTARNHDGTSVGWGGQAARDWDTVDYRKVTQHAIDMAKQGMNPVAIEPGRRTAILTPAALAPLLRFFAEQWDATSTNMGHTALSKSSRGGNKLHQRILDPRFTMMSDPADPDGGYRPYIVQDGVATPPMTWVERGTLTNLAYSVYDAMGQGKQYAALPHSFHLSGGTMSLEQMIARCQEGIFVNRISDVDIVDDRTCLLTGATHGGCFLIKDGKISKPVKNFRILDSPFFFLNNVEALGVPERAAFGSTPQGARETGWNIYGTGDWPRQPMILPAMMVRDFNFSALADVA